MAHSLLKNVMAQCHRAEEPGCPSELYNEEIYMWHGTEYGGKSLGLKTGVPSLVPILPVAFHRLHKGCKGCGRLAICPPGVSLSISVLSL